MKMGSLCSIGAFLCLAGKSHAVRPENVKTDSRLDVIVRQSALVNGCPLATTKKKDRSRGPFQDLPP